MLFPNDFNLLTPEALATYVIGIFGIGYGFRQLRINLKLNKKAEVFDDLSKKINQAKDLIDKIASVADSLINLIAKEADASSNFAQLVSNITQAENELDRRVKQLAVFEKKQIEHLDAIYDSQREIIKIVEKIDKTSVISLSAKESAKYVYFVASDQHVLIRKANDVILSLNVITNLGEVPNISPQTFKAIINLYAEITSRNNEIKNYLDDLEVILHNDLVKGIFGKARRGILPAKYLDKSGFKDKRVKKALR